jgi:hypothetical protein
MPGDTLRRLAEVVRRELGARNARVEIGGDPPDEPEALWRELSGGYRVVALFDAPPADREELIARLDALVESFSTVVTEATPVRRAIRVPAAHALAGALADLVAGAGGVGAAVIDAASPVVWGESGAGLCQAEDVDAAISAAALDERARASGIDAAALLSLEPAAIAPALAATGAGAARAADIGWQIRTIQQRGPAAGRDPAGWRRYLLVARAIATARRLIASSPRPGVMRASTHEQGFGLLAREFATIYVLLIAFDGPFVGLHAEGALVHALPRIERLVLSLPPAPQPAGGPTAKSARVVSLALRRRRKR